MNRNDVNPEMRDDVAMDSCIGLLELCSVAKGVEVADAVLKEAKVDMLFATNVQPGKYLMLYTGSVRDVESSTARGVQLAGGDLVDRLVIQQVDEQVVPMLKRKGGKINGKLDAIGVVETSTVAASIVACDLALKTATVDLIDFRIANGLDGKSFFVVTGEVSDVRSAVAAGARMAQERNQLVRDVVIPSPHADLVKHL
ncbi:MAG TPA: BMC domain-containing protein [Planctomycetota bacterium]|jgi:microcompartment protein CcmL/EutN|nr:BMC domain-containing protein [Planctomycetota bacterium]